MPEKAVVSKESDFAEFTDYISIVVPISCGERFGVVSTYSHKDYLKNSLLENYKKELTKRIEMKKYYDSSFCSFDVGPTIAVANLIEEGEYAEFIKSFNHGDIKLTGLEHVLKVREKGITHHLMPQNAEGIFEFAEQMGVIQFALIQKVISERKKIENPNLERFELLLKDDKKFPKMFREQIFDKQGLKTNMIEGYPREYKNCAIYRNLFQGILQELNIDLEDVEAVDSISKVLSNNYQLA